MIHTTILFFFLQITQNSIGFVVPDSMMRRNVLQSNVFFVKLSIVNKGIYKLFTFNCSFHRYTALLNFSETT